LTRLYTALTISMKFLSIGAKTILGQRASYLFHELEVVGEIVDSIELRAEDLIRLLEVI
jgi:hypothetical protein